MLADVPARFPLPIGLRLSQAARAVERAFDAALGEAAFARLRDTAIAFDAKLRAGLADADLATLSTLLGHLAANAGAGEAAPPWGALDR